MKINVSPYDEDTSRSILNFSSFEEREHYLAIIRFYWDVLHSLKLSSLQLFKKFLGRQKITKNYTCRNWIWTFTDDEEKMFCIVWFQRKVQLGSMIQDLI